MSRAEGTLITVNDLEEICGNSKDSLYEIAGNNGRDPKIYLHWSAMPYNMSFDDYHICIDDKGELHKMTDSLSDVIAHTYHRNSGAVAVSLNCCYNGTTNDLGDYAPTKMQIEKMAETVAYLCHYLDITNDKQHVLTHGEAANNEDGEYCHEPYACWSDPQPSDGITRWDLEFLGTDESPEYNPFATDGSRGGDVLRGKIQFYINKLFNNGEGNQ